jgi:hypothetical protein
MHDGTIFHERKIHFQLKTEGAFHVYYPVKYLSL